MPNFFKFLTEVEIPEHFDAYQYALINLRTKKLKCPDGCFIEVPKDICKSIIEGDWGKDDLKEIGDFRCDPQYGEDDFDIVTSLMIRSGLNPDVIDWFITSYGKDAFEECRSLYFDLSPFALTQDEGMTIIALQNLMLFVSTCTKIMWYNMWVVYKKSCVSYPAFITKLEH